MCDNCLLRSAIDSSLENMSETTPSSRTSKEAVRLMIVVLAGMCFLALYANVQRLRRAKIEEVRVTSFEASTPVSGAH